MSPPYLDILETAIDQYKIPNVVYIVGERHAWTIIETGTIFIPPPGTLHNLLFGLHEIGHIALEHPTRRSPRFREWTLFEMRKILKEEQEAWRFAFQEIDNHKMFIDIKTLGVCRGQYKNYVNRLLSLRDIKAILKFSPLPCILIIP